MAAMGSRTAGARGAVGRRAASSTASLIRLRGVIIKSMGNAWSTGNHRAWVVRHSVCRRGICHSVLSGGVGRASPRSGSAGCTLDSRLRVGIGYGKQRGVRYIGDLVCSLGTDDRSRFHQLVARSPASPISRGLNPAYNDRIHLGLRSLASGPISGLGQERRPPQQKAARQIPLCFVSDRDRAAVQYVAKGLGCVKSRRRLTAIE